ncbi:hypothetical protein [uncultured Salinisphaera sp.]|uniref:DUF1641 domain-containing protein n=1 Tax=uncultured Salinisphaera sp. TaxID=359372 RepID=UPI0032B1F2BD|tara:strand:- start:331 stop:855 length:525 start_codon:yes stop_codon:yes gene_type:complete
MAEQIHFRPEQAKRLRPETVDELEKFEGRIAEINGLLDQLYESGLMRWLKDFVGAMPEISMIALDGLNSEQGRAGMRNLLVVAQQLGRFDPDQLERMFEAVHAGADRAGETAEGRHESPYNPPGVTGVFKLLRDEELWHTLAPLIEGAKAYSAESRRLAGEAEEGESGHDTSRG